MFLMKKKKRINHRLMHVLRYIWKHLSNHDVFEKGAVKKKNCTNSHKKRKGEEAPMPRTVRGLPQTERHFCRCYACGWSCWFGASDWTCWSKPVRAICGGSCCFGARSTPVRAIWKAESFPSTLSFSWLWRGALRSCLLMASSTGSGNESDSLAYTRRPQVPSLEPLTLPFYCSPVPVLKNRLNSRSEVMILSRARDALQTPADTRFQWKGQGRGLKNTHKSHFAFPRLPEVVKIKGMHGTPDRTAWTSSSHGEKKRKVLLPEQAWRPQAITAELEEFSSTSLDPLGKILDNRRTTKTLRNKHKGSRSKGLGGWKREEGSGSRVWGRPRTVRGIGASSPLSFFVAVCAFFFQRPLVWGAQCPSPRMLTICNRRRADKRSSTSSSDQMKVSLNVPASSSCKHAPIALSEDDRIGYYPQTFRFVFTSSSCKRGLTHRKPTPGSSVVQSRMAQR